MTQYPEWQAEMRELQQKRNAKTQAALDKASEEYAKTRHAQITEILGYLGLHIEPDHGVYTIDSYRFHDPAVEHRSFLGWHEVKWKIYVSRIIHPDLVGWCHDNKIRFANEEFISTCGWWSINNDWNNQKIELADRIDVIDRWYDRVTKAMQRNNPALVQEYRRW